MRPETQRTWAERSVKVLHRKFPVSDFENWEQCQLYSPQVLAAAEHIEQWQFKSDAAAELLMNSGVFLYKQAQNITAEPLIRRGLTRMARD